MVPAEGRGTGSSQGKGHPQGRTAPESGCKKSHSDTTPTGSPMQRDKESHDDKEGNKESPDNNIHWKPYAGGPAESKR